MTNDPQDHLQADHLVLYHGGRRWEGKPTVPACRPGRYECGPGIYLTTSASTANKYAKGGGALMQMHLSPDIVWLEQSSVALADAIGFVKGLSRVPARANIVEDLKSNAQRMKSDQIGASVLVNLMVNYDALGGQNGPALAAWLTEQGIDASLHRANGLSGPEDWVVVFNPAVIASTQKLKQSDVDWNESQLPDVKDQLATIAPAAPVSRSKMRG